MLTLSALGRPPPSEIVLALRGAPPHPPGPGDDPCPAASYWLCLLACLSLSAHRAASSGGAPSLTVCPLHGRWTDAECAASVRPPLLAGGSGGGRTAVLVLSRAGPRDGAVAACAHLAVRGARLPSLEEMAGSLGDGGGEGGGVADWVEILVRAGRTRTAAAPAPSVPAPPPLLLFTSGTIALASMPLYHVGGISSMVAATAAGWRIVFPRGGRGDVRLLLVGGQGMNARQARQARAAFPHARIVSTYA